MSTRLLGRPTGTSPIVSAPHSSFPRAWSPNEARWEPRRGVIPELLLDRTAFWGRQQPASLDKTLIARGHRPPQEPDATAIECGRRNWHGPDPGLPHSRTFLPRAVYSRI